LTFVGVGLALLAIFLVSRPPSSPSDANKTRRGFPPGFGLALLSGVSVGIFFLSLARTSMAAGMWPLVAARISSISLFGVIAVVARRTLRMDRTATGTATLGGALDMAANAVYMTAARVGPLSIVVTLASLYPASTVLLARWILREHLSGTQIAGIACALVAVVLIVSQGAA
jgi:drug/metabolite transporter (DMT)-like permease